MDALEAKYLAARAAVVARDCEAAFFGYEAALNGSVAVLCRSLDDAKALLSSESAVYGTFYHQRESGMRRAETSPIETQREASDVRLFPHYHKEIRYAALSLDGRGATAWGPCSLILKAAAISHRATAFWQNAVDFCNAVCPRQDEPIPPGFRAVWASRAKLAAAKGEPMVLSTTTAAEFPRILLEGARFVEVHIFGPFDRQSIEKVLVPAPTTRADRALVSGIRSVIKKAGLAIVVEEY